MIDTLRVLVSLDCNLRCEYCCNQLQSTQKRLRHVTLDSLPAGPFKCVCITGGEPLLFLDRVRMVCLTVWGYPLIVLYTNGTLMTEDIAGKLGAWGVAALNVSLHNPQTFNSVIRRVLQAVDGLGVRVRFHVWEKYQTVAGDYPQLHFKFWKMGDCERSNEELIVLEAATPSPSPS